MSITRNFKFIELTRGGSIYFKELFVEVPESYFAEELGYDKPPKVFEDRGTRGYRQNFVYRTTDENGEPKEIWLHYLRDLEMPTPDDTEIPVQSETGDTEPPRQAEPVEPVAESSEQLSLLSFD